MLLSYISNLSLAPWTARSYFISRSRQLEGDAERIDLFKTYMSGKARVCVEGLLGKNINEFRVLVLEMQRLFSKYSPDNSKLELQKVKRKSNESLRIYALRLVLLVRLAYPMLETDSKHRDYFEDLKKDSFIRGLNPDLIQSLMVRSPVDLDDALRYAEILEADFGLKRKENLQSNLDITDLDYPEISEIRHKIIFL
ncbi:unnamed protein product [Brachionus calyciflorus]|uniref:Uncharacterized protein n=1 Tax=Brachionus calyciflorus TaxID=104777 RepID=A0A813N0K3_9BILA|nr:unnamed protein product [Brachionus calyciflorus]